MTDKIHRFIFDNYAIRGEILQLASSSETMLSAHQYPPIIASLLQQAAAVSVLLATTLKFEGKISIQLQAPGKLKRLIVQTTHQLGFRGLAHIDQEADFSTTSFAELTQNGQMSITIEPKKGNRYQGIVPLDGVDLATCVENYFALSEQLKTKIWLFSETSSTTYPQQQAQVFGLMLQALPNMSEQHAFEHLSTLVDTLEKEESLTTDAPTLLHRLFHQESLSSLMVDPIQFECGCSREKMLNSLKLLGEEEISEILQEQGNVSVECEFCLSQYSFEQLDIKQLLSVEGNLTRH